MKTIMKRFDGTLSDACNATSESNKYSLVMMYEESLRELSDSGLPRKAMKVRNYIKNLHNCEDETYIIVDDKEINNNGFSKNHANYIEIMSEKETQSHFNNALIEEYKNRDINKCIIETDNQFEYWFFKIVTFPLRIIVPVLIK